MRKTNLFTEPQTAANSAETAPTRKFMFERSFDSTAPRAPERKPVTLKPEQYDALKQESYDAGFAAGRAAGLDDQNSRLMALLATVDGKIEAMFNTMQTLHQESVAGMRRIALAIARKFVPDFAAKHGLQEIEALLDGVMGEMVHEPRLVVRIHESQFDVLNEKIAALAAQKAYAGKVVVLADAEIAAGDCRIEWADGGMERNGEAMWRKVEQTISP
jgi:flagellar assembly protein FliH